MPDQEEVAMTEDNIKHLPDEASRKLIRQAQSVAASDEADRELCPPMEDIAALADGRLKEDEEERIMKHLSACDSCYRTFLLGSRLNEAGSLKRNIIAFRPLALAASILIAVVSLFFVYRTLFPPVTKPAVLELNKDLAAFLQNSGDKKITDAQTLKRLVELLKDHGCAIPGQEVIECRIRWPQGNTKFLFILPERAEIKLKHGRLEIKILK